ncbi:hypothetical protein [uncultured Phenylobacterium sp.]|uniref:hypothetical protein n=1 Tax=uncultured Phenylobacterium sp. TaxID=349273 RepID=UPI0025F28E94|nr:hypothetical protein [uncultured Phenylobacterium sp.]
MRSLILASLVIAGPAFAQGRITEADVRGFLTRQEAAWNAGRLDAYFAGFTPDASFTDQAYVGDKPPVRYGTSTLPQARTQARKSLQGAKPRETGRILRIAIAADGRSARVDSRVESVVKSRRLCAARVQTLISAKGGLRSRGQTDTFIKCPK